jgi:hypothetical protein
MKQCPQCNRTYKDETLSYCVNDGTRLSASFDPEETVVLTRPLVAPVVPIKQANKLIPIAILLVIVTLVAIFVQGVWSRNPSSPFSPLTQRCVLFNNDPKENSVMTRINCDRYFCDDDPVTAIGSKPNGTKVERLNTPAIRSKYKKFNWVQVVITDEHRPVVWVSDTKISCKDSERTEALREWRPSIAQHRER